MIKLLVILFIIKLYDWNNIFKNISIIIWKNLQLLTFTGEKILPFDQRGVTEQAKFTYSPLGKALEKQTKMIEDQGKKQIKAVEVYLKQLVESSKVIKKNFNINRDSTPPEEQKKIFNELITERSSEHWNLEERINSDNLIWKFKNERRSPKDFRNYQNIMDLFKNLKDGSVNPRKVSKSQNNFKSDLGEIKKGNRKSRSEYQISVIQNVENFFDLREKIIAFLEIFGLSLRS